MVSINYCFGQNNSLKPKVKWGRPRSYVNSEIIVLFRESDHLGWSGIANKYFYITGNRISRDTVRRRYFEFKIKQANAGRQFPLCEHSILKQLKNAKPL